MNDAVIVGGNHHNGLGLARILGLNGVKVHSVVVDSKKESFLRCSKYVATSNAFETEKEAFDFIKETFAMPEKMVLIPYSDGAAYELDCRLDEFANEFYVPSINGKQGQIAFLMDKQNQSVFAQKHGIKMAYTLTLYFDKPVEIENVPYPCIIKPVISAEGDKKDIAICRNKDELIEQIEKYKKEKYHRALVQEYLDIDYEIDVFGCTLHQEPYICEIPTHTVRSWPPKGGTNSFSYIITDAKIVNGCREIIEELRKSGFYGLYDIELFVVGEQILLNEINYRNSGDVYMGISQQYFYPYAWYLDCLNKQANIAGNTNRADYAMTECADVRNALNRNVSIVNWWIDYKRTNDYALRFKGDMKPAINRYLYYIEQFLKRKKM